MLFKNLLIITENRNIVNTWYVSKYNYK